MQQSFPLSPFSPALAFPLQDLLFPQHHRCSFGGFVLVSFPVSFSSFYLFLPFPLFCFFVTFWHIDNTVSMLSLLGLCAICLCEQILPTHYVRRPCDWSLIARWPYGRPYGDRTVAAGLLLQTISKGIVRSPYGGRTTAVRWPFGDRTVFLA